MAPFVKIGLNRCNFTEVDTDNALTCPPGSIMRRRQRQGQ